MVSPLYFGKWLSPSYLHPQKYHSYDRFQIKKDFSKPTVTDDAHYIFYLRNEAENTSQSG
jgi:hypothetical protein